MAHFYHFTSEVHLRKILQLGKILPGESNVGSPSDAMEPHGDHLGPDVVWLLDEPERPVPKRGDPRNHGLFGHVVDKTVIRITVDVKAIPWTSWAAGEHMNPLWRTMFIQAGGGEDAARHWYVVPAPIRSLRWVAIDRMDGQALDPDEQEGIEPWLTQ